MFTVYLTLTICFTFIYLFIYFIIFLYIILYTFYRLYNTQKHRLVLTIHTYAITLLSLLLKLCWAYIRHRSPPVGPHTVFPVFADITVDLRVCRHILGWKSIQEHTASPLTSSSPYKLLLLHAYNITYYCLLTRLLLGVYF